MREKIPSEYVGKILFEYSPGSTLEYYAITTIIVLLSIILVYLMGTEVGRIMYDILN